MTRRILSQMLLGAGLLLALHSPPLAAEDKAADWPQFRGPGGLGTGTGKDLPVSWSPSSNVVWKTKLPGPGSSSPVVVGNRIFLTCYTGYRNGGDTDQIARHVLGLNRADGNILWTKEIKATPAEQVLEQGARRVETHGYASSTPAADAERVYIFFGKTGVFAFDHAGKQVWQTSVGTGHHRYGSATSPVLFGDTVIVNASVESSALMALNRKTGDVVWKSPGIQDSWNTPLLVDVPGGKTELVVTMKNLVVGVDPATGERLWTCRGVDDYMVPSVVAHDGVVYAVLGREGAVLAIRAGGQGDVTNSRVLWRVAKSRNVASPVYSEGRLYFATEELGMIRCLDAKTGKAVFEERLQPSPGEIYASPLLADGKLYIMSRQRGAYVLEAGSEFQLLAHNVLDDKSLFNSSPAVVDNRLLLRSDEYLYCLCQR